MGGEKPGSPGCIALVRALRRASGSAAAVSRLWRSNVRCLLLLLTQWDTRSAPHANLWRPANLWRSFGVAMGQPSETTPLTMTQELLSPGQSPRRVSCIRFGLLSAAEIHRMSQARQSPRPSVLV